MSEPKPPRLWITVPLAALAGGMAWGIRGQYGHETGAMMAGVLVGLVFTLFYCARSRSLFAARAVAMFALAIGIGGSMTYGQTVGLTHDPDLVGNAEALRWGLLGLFIKGAIWIGLGAVFLAMGLSETRYRPSEIALLLVSMIFLYFVGVELLNSPFDPANKKLPAVYFSADWHWKGDVAIRPRPERWGGLLFALTGVYVYTAFLRRDRLARHLTLFGLVGGGLGFAGGQCLQAFHAWHPDLFAQERWAHYDQHINWWNMMETTFGLVFGATLAVGIGLNRHLIRAGDGVDQRDVEMTPAGEWLLVAIHVAALVAWNFFSFDYFDSFSDLAISMVLIPMIAVSAGRVWPYLLVLPIVTLPIAGKTLRELSYEHEVIPALYGWLAYVAAPLAVTTVAALLLARGALERESGARFSRWALFVATWVFFALNLAFFRYPWPWQDWTGRTPNGLIYFGCAIFLTGAAIFARRRKRTPADGAPAKPNRKANNP